ncbi:par-3 family cell polarity regulator beta a [Nematolebias whitei]|uniref:par-3 family cell polarity regulator beta a n=1 Tax=Nematolebias whitei TaxID=451745 RepID=UPI001896F6C7|nr:par-3 family cell polarity regulator beta a [Nematolebias whitei]
MKVTVTFGDTAVVVPCKAGWTVRDLVDQATRRYRRVLEQDGDTAVNIHHLEYDDGGILDMDDMISDLVEDREKLVAVFDDDQRGSSTSPSETMSNSFSSADASPEPMHYFPHLEYEDPSRGEIEREGEGGRWTYSTWSDKGTAVHRRSSAVVLSSGSSEEMNDVLKGALERLETNSPPPKMSPKVHFSALTKTVEFPGDRGPLGIHVVPYCSSLSGRTLGLHIKGVEVNSRSRRENLFKEDECIVQINDTPLQDKTFAESQKVFQKAMAASSVQVEVLPVANKSRYEKRLIGQIFSSDDKDSTLLTKSPMVVRALPDAQPKTKPNPKVDIKRPETRVRTPEPALRNASPVQLQSGHGTLERGSPTPPPGAGGTSPTFRMTNPNQSPLASKSSTLPGLSNLTNKKGGKRIKIDLKKGTEGLGFTVVTRDSTVHGPGPILIKNILPRGAAVKDGRLQPGDRILEVNGVDMTGRSQEELVAMLRSTKQGERIYVVVARQEDMFLPRELKGEEASGQVAEDGREQLMYEIPLNETGSAGLGVSLKGNKSKETGEDLGIFIKSIIHGGAAYKDGRLSINDQLIAVNGESLLGRSNHAAMETLRRSMSSEGNARGTIQLVVLRVPKQAQSGKSSTSLSSGQPDIPAGSTNQEPRGHDALQRPPGPTGTLESTINGTGHAPKASGAYTHGDSGGAAATFTNGNYGHYSDAGDEQGFPPPPSPDSVEEMNRVLNLTPPPHRSELSDSPPEFYSNHRHDEYNVPRNRASKSLDMVADESNVGSLVGHRNDFSYEEALGPTLGLVKSSSLESLQTAVSEAKHKHSQAQVPIHRPRPHMVRGRGCNQSFRIAIDKSYDGPSEDDDDGSDYSSGNETPASTSSRQDLDEEKKVTKKTKAKKKEKKSKGKKKAEDYGDELEKKTKKKGFGLLRFGKKKDDKSKGSKNKLDVLSEEELDRVPDSRDSYDPRYQEIHSGYTTPDRNSLPDVEDDDSDPHYARIGKFRQPPSPLSPSRTPSPALPSGGQNLPQAPPSDIEGLYAKVNKFRPPPGSQNLPQAESDQRIQGLRREYQQARAAPGYEELDAARRRVLEYDPQRAAPRGAESRSRHRHEEKDVDYTAPPRRDPYDYPTHSKPVPREQGPYPSHYQDPPVSSNANRLPLPQLSNQQAPNNPRYYPSAQQHRAALRQDVPPSPTAGRRGQQYYDTTAGRNYRQASPGRYVSPDRNARERYPSPDRYQYGGERQPRRKNVMIDAV